MSDKAERMRALNDQLRTTFVGGAVMITQGVYAIPIPRRKLILEQVRGFAAFTPDNDPYGEHDCPSPAVRERAGKHGDGEIGWCAAVGNGFDDARRHEGERGEVPDVALDLVLAAGDLLE